MALKKILVVAGDFVYPPNHGGRVDMWNRILTLHDMGFCIHLVCTVKERPEEKNIRVVLEKVQKLDLVHRKNRIIDMIHSYPLQIVSRKKLATVELEKSYDYLLLEGTYVYAILFNPELHVKHKLLRMHNDEATYFKALSEADSSPLRKFYYWIESKKFRNIDSEIINRVHNVLFISYEEMMEYTRRFSNIHGCFLPASVRLNFKKRPRKNHTALLVASFFMRNNQEAITYYLKEIHPLIKIPDYQIIIAGNSRGESIEWLTQIADQYPNVHVYDSPEDLQPLYEKASVFLNTMLHGAGVKLKTINAIVEGLPVVSTSTGNEGTGLRVGKEILVEDDHESFAKSVTNILMDSSKAEYFVESAQRYIAARYNQQKVLEEYFDDFED